MPITRLSVRQHAAALVVLSLGLVVLALVSSPQLAPCLPQALAGHDAVLASRLLMLLVILLGASIGSFLNVVIHRLPRGQSLVLKGSHCPHCGHPIRPRHNVPVLGWVMLQGQCYACHQSIAPRYPWIELAAAAVFVWLAAGACPWLARHHHTTTPAWLAWCLVGRWVLAASLLVCACITAQRQRVPRTITLSCWLLALAVWMGLVLVERTWEPAPPWGDDIITSVEERPDAGPGHPWPRRGWVHLATAGLLATALFALFKFNSAMAALGGLAGAVLGPGPSLAMMLLVVAAWLMVRWVRPAWPANGPLLVLLAVLVVLAPVRW